jgi:hypothetical protein
MWPVSVFFVSFLPGIILLLPSLSKNLTTSRRRFSLDSTRFLNIGKESNFFAHLHQWFLHLEKEQWQKSEKRVWHHEKFREKSKKNFCLQM